jgi:hypothetical protein
MLSKRFLIVPELSSAARMPLPLATIAAAMSSMRSLIHASFGSASLRLPEPAAKQNAPGRPQSIETGIGTWKLPRGGNGSRPLPRFCLLHLLQRVVTCYMRHQKKANLPVSHKRAGISQRDRRTS